MRKSRTVVVLGFLFIQLLAFVLSGIATTLISSKYIVEDQERYHAALRLTVLELAQRTELSPEEIADVLSSSTYKIALSDNASSLNSWEWARLQAGFSVTSGGRLHRTTYFLLDDTLMEIGTYQPNIQLVVSSMRSFFSAIIMLMIVTLTIFFSSKAVVRPVVDITEATRRVADGDLNVEVKLPKSHRGLGRAHEIVELIDNFNRMIRELRGIEYLRRDFTSNVSHEIKTPLAAISGYARLLQMDSLPDEERKEYAASIAEASVQLSRMADNLLKLTRLESQQISAPAKPYPLDEQLRRIVGTLYPTIEKKELSLEVDLQNGVTICADEELIAQVWINLIGNAVKFTPEKGHIEISLRVRNSAACVSVSDSGIGMDEETQARIFEKFYQADKSHHGGGNGLGLPLVKRIVDIHAGEIDVKSAPGKGSCFTVKLPVGGA